MYAKTPRSAASTSPTKTSPATTFLPKTSQKPKPLSASANCSASKPTAPGKCTRKVPNYSTSSMQIAAAHSGFWCILTTRYLPASNRWISRCLANASASAKRKECSSSPKQNSGGILDIMSSKNVIVIGGGLAGLAAGVALAESGRRVRLFEQRPYLGGRATSYVLPSGEHVDNCQHVTLGCCTNLDDFYRRVGSANKVKFFDRLLFLDPQGRRGEMQAGFLPAPFHMTGSFAAFAPLSLGDKLSIARAMLTILRTAGKPKEVDTPTGISMHDWLKSQKQTPRAIERFWRVVLVSALDEELDRTDARFGIDVFWKAFLANGTGYRMGVPSVPLAELYDGCRTAIEKKGGEVILRAPVRGLKIENGELAGIRFDEG